MFPVGVFMRIGTQFEDRRREFVQSVVMAKVDTRYSRGESRNDDWWAVRAAILIWSEQLCGSVNRIKGWISWRKLPGWQRCLFHRSCVCRMWGVANCCFSSGWKWRLVLRGRRKQQAAKCVTSVTNGAHAEDNTAKHLQNVTSGPNGVRLQCTLQFSVVMRPTTHWTALYSKWTELIMLGPIAGCTQ